MMMDAMYHLGRILVLLSDLAPDHRCKALNDAQEFFNEENPDCQIEPSGCGYSLLVHKHPGLDDDYDAAQEPRCEP